MPDYCISRARINDLSDKQLIRTIIETFWPARVMSDAEELRHLASGTPGQRAVYAVQLFFDETAGGGLQQFFFNSSGLLAGEVYQGLARLGLEKTRRLFESAISYFPASEVPISRPERIRLLLKMSDSAFARFAEWWPYPETQDYPRRYGELSRSLYRGECQRFFESLNARLSPGSGFYRLVRTYIDQHPRDFFFD